MSPFETMKQGISLVICTMALTVVAVAQTQRATGSPVEQGSRVGDMSTLSCAGYIRYERLPKTPEIVGAEQEPERHTFVEGDVVYLNAGAQQGVKDGQLFQIIRPRGDVKGVHREKRGYLGTYVQELGRLQVFEVRERTSLAQITFSCDSVLLGDLVAPVPYREVPLKRSEAAPVDRFANPTGKQTGRLMMSRDGREMVTRSDVVYIDLGSEDGAKIGDYLTVYRPLGTGGPTRTDNEESARGRATGFQSNRYRGGGVGIQAQRAKDSTAFVNSEGRYRYKPITTHEIKGRRSSMPRKIVGEMVIVNIQTRTATALITRAVSEMHTGDWVEIQ